MDDVRYNHEILILIDKGCFVDYQESHNFNIIWFFIAKMHIFGTYAIHKRNSFRIIQCIGSLNVSVILKHLNYFL